MVIYEVNLSINNEIFSDYYTWLLAHVKKILTFSGFTSCEIGLVENQNEDYKNHLRVSYFVDSYENLQSYLSQNAEAMRADALKHFGEQFSATRRVILEPLTLESN
jgi:hypothetical protein